MAPFALSRRNIITPCGQYLSFDAAAMFMAPGHLHAQQAKYLPDEQRRVQTLLSVPGASLSRENAVAVNISPLVGAAFSSNWMLFREVYDAYEKWTGGRWSRENVRNT